MGAAAFESADFSGGVEAVEACHVAVHEHDVVVAAADHLQGVHAVSDRFDLAANAGERVGDQGLIELVVLDDQRASVEVGVGVRAVGADAATGPRALGVRAGQGASAVARLIEHLVQNREQFLAGAVHALHGGALLRVERGLEQELARADHDRHRRAKFVAERDAIAAERTRADEAGDARQELVPLVGGGRRGGVDANRFELLGELGRQRAFDALA